MSSPDVRVNLREAGGRRSSGHAPDAHYNRRCRTKNVTIHTIGKDDDISRQRSFLNWQLQSRMRRKLRMVFAVTPRQVALLVIVTQNQAIVT